MPYTCLYVLWVISVYSWKSPLQIATDIDFCDEARRLGAARTGVPFPLWPGCRGREPPCLRRAGFPWSNRFYDELGNSRRGVLLYFTRGEERSFLR
jgi:hypothetical protein